MNTVKVLYELYDKSMEWCMVLVENTQYSYTNHLKFLYWIIWVLHDKHMQWYMVLLENNSNSYTNHLKFLYWIIC